MVRRTRRSTTTEPSPTDDGDGAIATLEPSDETAAARDVEQHQVVDEPPKEGVLCQLPLAKVVKRGTNYRRRRDASDDAELLDSIRTHGILQPLLLRPLFEHEGISEQPMYVAPFDGRPAPVAFEVVAGERRYDAATEAELATVPALVRELTEAQVAETRLIENIKRKDPDPLDEADAFAELVERFGYSLEQLQRRAGKSLSYVRERLVLAKLCAEARELYVEDKLSASHALEIARLQNPAVQVEAVAWLKKQHLEDRGWRGPLTVQGLRDELTARFHLRMREAPWKLEDAELLPACGPCSTCTKRTKNVPELFPEEAKAGDSCTDPHCWSLKLTAFRRRREEELAAKGTRVLKGKDAKAALDRYGSAKKGWVKVEDLPAAAKKKLERSERGVVLHQNRPVEVVEREKAAVAAKAAKVKLQPERTSPRAASSGSYETENRKRKKRESHVPFAVAALRDALSRIVHGIDDRKGFALSVGPFGSAVTGQLDGNEYDEGGRGALAIAAALKLADWDTLDLLRFHCAGKIEKTRNVARRALRDWAGNDPEKLVWAWRLASVASDAIEHCQAFWGDSPLDRLAKKATDLADLCKEAGADLAAIVDEQRRKLRGDLGTANQPEPAPAKKAAKSKKKGGRK